MPVIFLITPLKPEVSPVEYEKWVRQRDYPFVESLANVESYQVHRVEGEISGASGARWSYIERIEVRSLEQHEKDLSTEAGMAIREELFRFIDRPKNVRFTSAVVGAVPRN